MVHLEQAQPEQLQELLAFAEEAFRTPEGKVDFPTLLPKLYGPGADSAPLHTVLYEDGAPAGLYCLKIQDFNIAGTALRVGGIGTVCVDGRSRGKGHLALLMQDAQERMQAAGCDIAMLGGQREREADRHPLGNIVQRHRQYKKGCPLPRGGRPLRPAFKMQMGQQMVQSEQKKHAQHKTAGRRRKAGYPGCLRLLDRGDQQTPDRGGDHHAGRETQKYPLDSGAYSPSEKENGGGTQRRHQKGKAGTPGCPQNCFHIRIHSFSALKHRGCFFVYL